MDKEKDEKSYHEININWARWIYGKTRENVGISTFILNRLLHILI